jgi:hypothetical protein
MGEDEDLLVEDCPDDECRQLPPVQRAASRPQVNNQQHGDHYHAHQNAVPQLLNRECNAAYASCAVLNRENTYK